MGIADAEAMKLPRQAPVDGHGDGGCRLPRLAVDTQLPVDGQGIERGVGVHQPVDDALRLRCSTRYRVDVERVVPGLIAPRPVANEDVVAAHAGPARAVPNGNVVATDDVRRQRAQADADVKVPARIEVERVTAEGNVPLASGVGCKGECADGSIPVAADVMHEGIEADGRVTRSHGVRLECDVPDARVPKPRRIGRERTWAEAHVAEAGGVVSTRVEAEIQVVERGGGGVHLAVHRARRVDELNRGRECCCDLLDRNSRQRGIRGERRARREHEVPVRDALDAGGVGGWA